MAKGAGNSLRTTAREARILETVLRLTDRQDKDAIHEIHLVDQTIAIRTHVRPGHEIARRRVAVSVAPEQFLTESESIRSSYSIGSAWVGEAIRVINR